MSDELKKLNAIIQRDNDDPITLDEFETLENIYELLSTRANPITHDLLEGMKWRNVPKRRSCCKQGANTITGVIEMIDMPKEIYARAYSQKPTNEDPDWWHASWGPDGKTAVKYTLTSHHTAEVERLEAEIKKLKKENQKLALDYVTQSGQNCELQDELKKRDDLLKWIENKHIMYCHVDAYPYSSQDKVKNNSNAIECFNEIGWKVRETLTSAGGK